MVTIFKLARRLAERQTAAVLSRYHSLPPSPFRPACSKRRWLFIYVQICS